MESNMNQLNWLNAFIICTLIRQISFVFGDSYFMSTGPVLGGLVSQDVARNTTLLLDQLLQGYDSRLRPGFGGPPTVVDVNLNVRSMGPISEQEMAYQMDCYFRQSWVDKRLEFSGPIKTLSVSVKILEKLWKPDTHFFNGQRSYLHTVTTPNKLLRIYQDGRILYSMRLTVKASCPMHLEKFPMDTQTCPLRFGSHGYDDSDVYYVWTHGLLRSIKMAADMRLSQFDLIGFPAGNSSYSDTRGRFSELFISFKLKRHMGYFMINFYVPCSLLVIISFVGFWINREATADRISLGTTTVLTMTFLGIDNRQDLPKVSYATALDIFVAVSWVFVLATVIQFAAVHFFTKYGTGEQYLDDLPDDEDQETEGTDNNVHRLHDGYFGDSEKKMCIVREGVNGETSVMLSSTYQKSKHKEKGSSPRQSCCSKFFSCIIGVSYYHHDDKKQKKYKGLSNSVSKIDKASRVIFPILFLVFNIFYWSLYLDGDVTAIQFT